MNKEVKTKEKLSVVFDKSNTLIENLLSTKYDLSILNFDSLQKYPDLVIFTGGADVNPDLYNENLGKYTRIDADLDAKCKKLYNNLRGRTKFLGICRGSQFLTVMSGGSLIQHVNGHTKEHDMTIGEDNKIIQVTSTHHQMLYPYTLDDDQFNLLGWSTYFNSDTYLNGKNEEYNLTKKFLEPEIVYYKNTNSLAIQGHPEFESASKDFKKYTLYLISRLLNNKLSKMEYTNPYNHIDYNERNIRLEPVPVNLEMDVPDRIVALERENEIIQGMIDRPSLANPPIRTLRTMMLNNNDRINELRNQIEEMI